MKKNGLRAAIAALALTAGLSMQAHAAGVNKADASKLLTYVKAHNLACMACHAVDHKVVGPAWIDVAKKYKKDPKAIPTLTERIHKGGVGIWGQIPMPPNQATEAQSKELAKLVLDLAK